MYTCLRDDEIVIRSFGFTKPVTWSAMMDIVASSLDPFEQRNDHDIAARVSTASGLESLIIRNHNLTALGPVSWLAWTTATTPHGISRGVKHDEKV